MEDERLFYIFWFLPWKTGVFSLFTPLSAVAEAPRPFGFLISVGCRSSDYFFFSVIGPLVTEGEGMLLAVFSYHESRPLQNSSYNLSFLNIFVPLSYETEVILSKFC